MKEFVAWLFSENRSDLAIGLFDAWHFMYLFIVFAIPITLYFLNRNKSEKSKLKVVRFFAYITVIWLIADFFFMPLSDSYSGIRIDKLPFHICTVMGVLIPFVQFNPKFKKIKNLVVTLSITSALMWMCYPGTALGGQPPFSYIIFETFMYHGFMFAWGFLNLAFGFETLHFKNMWKEFIAILLMLLWAGFGNTVYPDNQNWLFINYSIFPFLPDHVMPYVVVFCIFGSCFVVYCLYFAIKAIANKLQNNKTV